MNVSVCGALQIFVLLYSVLELVFHVYVYEYMCECVCVCVRERMCVYVCHMAGRCKFWFCSILSSNWCLMNMYICTYVSVCACERERMCVYICHLAGP